MRIQQLQKIPFSLVALVLLAGTTIGQTTQNAVATSSITPPSSLMSITSTTLSRLSTSPTPTTTSHTSAISTISSATSTSTDASNNNDNSSQPSAKTKASSAVSGFLGTYYPLLIGVVLLVLFLLGITWKLRRRHKKLIADYLTTRQQEALAQDVDTMMYSTPSRSRGSTSVGSPSTHGHWYSPGGYRAGIGTPGNRFRRGDRVEGLDENGLAPPPYKADHDLQISTALRTTEDIPLRTLARTSKPPEYGEVIREVTGEEEREANGSGR